MVLAPNLSGCALLVEYGVRGAESRARQKMQDILNNSLTEKIVKHPCWGLLKPILNPVESQIEEMLSQPGEELKGTLVHTYTTEETRASGDVFEIRAAPCTDMLNFFIKMQLFVAKLGPPGQVARYSFNTHDPAGHPLLDDTHIFYTVRRNPAAPLTQYELVSYSEGDICPLFPSGQMMSLTALLTVPLYQEKGHASVLVSAIWKHVAAALPGVSRIHYEPANTAEEEERQDFEAFALKVHLARMVEKKIFVKIPDSASEPLDIMGDAFRGDPGLTEWERLRESKRAAYATPQITSPPGELVWSRRTAEAAAAHLLLPISSVRELFEISLMKCLRTQKDKKILSHFVLRRIYEMDRVDIQTATLQDNVVSLLESNLNQTKEAYKGVAEAAQKMRQNGMLAPCD
eukprot:TRINITY_DN3847_c0_g1_i3.p1 TRINITY_DN3847_c0_g1~~TRINITY_DN3847_c0_g1_i3.p1  ORF type:complete len:438 (+),score=119.77 TRINITY_DN3847_c0_g1_i3:107-1315(+)